MKNHENYPEESVEIFGKDTVFVEGFSKIIEYQSETVKIKYKKYFAQNNRRKPPAFKYV